MCVLPTLPLSDSDRLPRNLTALLRDVNIETERWGGRSCQGTDSRDCDTDTRNDNTETLLARRGRRRVCPTLQQWPLSPALTDELYSQSASRPVCRRSAVGGRSERRRRRQLTRLNKGSANQSTTPTRQSHHVCVVVLLHIVVVFSSFLRLKPTSQLRFDYDTMIQRRIRLRRKWSKLRYAFDSTAIRLRHDYGEKLTFIFCSRRMEAGARDAL